MIKNYIHLFNYFSIFFLQQLPNSNAQVKGIIQIRKIVQCFIVVLRKNQVNRLHMNLFVAQALSFQPKLKIVCIQKIQVVKNVLAITIMRSTVTRNKIKSKDQAHNHQPLQARQQHNKQLQHQRLANSHQQLHHHPAMYNAAEKVSSEIQMIAVNFTVVYQTEMEASLNTNFVVVLALSGMKRF